MEEGGTPVIYELTAESAAGQRIDKYLSGQLADLSRSYLQKLLKDGGVEVNKKPVKSAVKEQSVRCTFGREPYGTGAHI